MLAPSGLKKFFITLVLEKFSLEGCEVQRFPVFFMKGRLKNLFTETNFMSEEQPKNPLHGITLEMILLSLVDQYGWKDLGRRIPIQCFRNDPSIKSSLKFLRATPWAREKVESLYLQGGGNK
jgi:hypothetical protein